MLEAIIVEEEGICKGNVGWVWCGGVGVGGRGCGYSRMLAGVALLNQCHASIVYTHLAGLRMKHEGVAG